MAWALLGGIVLLGLLLSGLYIFYGRFHDDEAQMYARGVALAVDGVWTHHGNRSSGNAPYVPGSLSTAAVGLPLMAWFSPFAPWVFLKLLYLAGWLLIDSALKSTVGLAGRVVFAALFWLTPVIHLGHFFNPDYMPFFAALHFWSAWKMRGGVSLRYSALHVVTIGFAAQFHLSVAILFFATLLMWWRNLVRPHWGGVALGAVVVLASLIPWALTALADVNILTSPTDPDNRFGHGLLRLSPLVAVVNWLKFGAFYVKTIELLAGFCGGGLVCLPGYVDWAWKIIFLPVMLALLGFAIYCNTVFFRQMRRFILCRETASSDRQWLSLYVVCVFAAMLFATAISPASTIRYHFFIVSPFCALPVVIIVSDLANKYAKKVNRGLVAAVVFAACLNMTTTLKIWQADSFADEFAEKVSSFRAGVYLRF